jgi:hypothetical protein
MGTRGALEIVDLETKDKQGDLGCGYGSERIRTALIKLKTEVAEPMPRARVRTATAVKPGFLWSCRRP